MTIISHVCTSETYIYMFMCVCKWHCAAPLVRASGLCATAAGANCTLSARSQRARNGRKCVLVGWIVPMLWMGYDCRPDPRCDH